MSGLSEEDREALARVIETTVGLGAAIRTGCTLCNRDIPCPRHVGVDAAARLSPIVEAIVTRAVNEALIEAADEIHGWRLNAIRASQATTLVGAQGRSRIRALTYARAEGIVRSNTT